MNPTIRILDAPDDPYAADEAFNNARKALLTAQPQNAKPLKPDKQEKAPTASTILVAIGRESDLWHSPDSTAYATLGTRTHAIRSRAFKSHLGARYFKEHDKAPTGQALGDALNVLEGIAIHDGPEYPVFTRVAGHEGKIYIFLADDAWRSVEIDKNGWRVVTSAPVRFRRPAAMLTLPEPVRGGRLDELRPYVNAPLDADWALMRAWLVQAVHPNGPYPILALHGEQGSAKSTTAKVLRCLVDPNASPLRTAPRDERDLAIAASNAWILALDNLSYLPENLSDAMCRLSTGGGFSTRALYTDGEESIFDATRPMIVTAIEDLATRSDLLERCVIGQLPHIPKQRRKTEKLFWAEFDRARPRILGGLFNALAGALRLAPSVQLEELPRMADFAVIAVADEIAAGGTGATFLNAYLDNQAGTHEQAIESSPVITAVREMLADTTYWEGTPSELLELLTSKAGEAVAKQKGWPKQANSLTNRLRRFAPNLRAVGIAMEEWREAGGHRRRVIRFTAAEKAPAKDRPDRPDRPETL